MIAEIVADIHFLYLAVFVFHLNENIFKKVIVMGLHFYVRHRVDS